MSNGENIIEWAIQEFDPFDYANYGEWKRAISHDFVENNRNSLDRILDRDEKDNLREAYEALIAAFVPEEYL